ncbi:hypothetical protein P3G55_05675 [Leptospira sp. 96542]|nr:hypothetical protein [Leptospira sp. 96542]
MQEILSFHCFNIPFYKLPFYLYFYPKRNKVSGLVHSESFLSMRLGEPIGNIRRYSFSKLAVLFYWRSEEDLEQFLITNQKNPIHSGWHIRLKLYRRWGKLQELGSANLYPKESASETPIVAITLARLKISQLFRFTKWGKPVEKQVRDHKGVKFAFAAFRPFRSFLTFSVWNSEREMVQMVQGVDPKLDGLEHKNAMLERNRKDFHTEFTTLRLEILEETGSI